MALKLLLAGLIVAALVGCGSHGTRERATTQRASDTLATHANGGPAHELATPDSLIQDTIGCAFVSRQLHPNARELLDEFLRRDAYGDFLSPGDWYFGAMMCSKGGTDVATLITGYEVDSLYASSDTARYGVRYAVQGSLDQDQSGGFISPGARQAVDTFVLVRTRFGWRIAAPESPIPHLLPEVARRNWSLTRTQDSLLLDSLSRAKR